MSIRLVAAGLVLLAGVVAGCSSPSETDSGADSSTVQTTTSISETTAAPVAGAVDDPVKAAVTYVASTDGLMAHSPVGRKEIFRRLLTPSALEAQVLAFEQAASEMALTLDVPVERLVWVEAPITATLVESAAGSASVDVWTVSILGAPDAGSPQQVWRTVHVDLEEVDGGWRIAAATADEGPTPAANELALQSGWDDFELVASWPPVVEGVGL